MQEGTDRPGSVGPPSRLMDPPSRSSMEPGPSPTTMGSYNVPVPYVYILRCADGSLYTGAAKDVARRVLAHQAGHASRYTRARLPVTLVWSRQVRTWSRALRDEYRIKRLSRAAKLLLIAPARQARVGARLHLAGASATLPS